MVRQAVRHDVLGDFTKDASGTLTYIVHSSIIHGSPRHSQPFVRHGLHIARSCEKQLSIAIQYIASSLHYSRQINAIILVFSNAFDEVSHQT